MKSLIAAALAASLVISFSAQAADNAANAAANELNQSIDIDTTSLEKPAARLSAMLRSRPRPSFRMTSRSITSRRKPMPA